MLQSPNLRYYNETTNFNSIHAITRRQSSSLKLRLARYGGPLDSPTSAKCGSLEAFYGRGEYDENKGRLLQRDLRVAKLAYGNGAALVLDLKRVLIDGSVIDGRGCVLVGEERGRRYISSQSVVSKLGSTK
jgi:hypothetical protein